MQCSVSSVQCAVCSVKCAASRVQCEVCAKTSVLFLTHIISSLPRPHIDDHINTAQWRFVKFSKVLEGEKTVRINE